MTTKVTLPLGEMPGVIRESVRSVLAAHGYVIAEKSPDGDDPAPLSDAEFEILLVEVGRNVAGTLALSLDENPENQ